MGRRRQSRYVYQTLAMAAGAMSERRDTGSKGSGGALAWMAAGVMREWRDTERGCSGAPRDEEWRGGGPRATGLHTWEE